MTFESDLKHAWKWLSVQLGVLIAAAPAIYENADVIQNLVPRPWFATIQTVLGLLVVANAMRRKT